jgi:hypothetical protein
MNRARVLPYGSALAVCLFAGVAQAGPVNSEQVWSYNWTPSALHITADGNSANNYIQVISESTGLAQGSASIGVASLPTFSTAKSSSPATFTNVPFSLNLTVTDTKTNNQNNLKFSGVFNGWLTASQAYLTWTPTSSMNQSATLSGHNYSVALYVTSPTTPGSLVSASITAVVTTHPEPSTLVLSGLGVGGLCWRAWRRRRTQTAPASV